MPIMRIKMFNGCSIDLKPQLVKALAVVLVNTVGGKIQGRRGAITDIELKYRESGSELMLP